MNPRNFNVGDTLAIFTNTALAVGNFKAWAEVALIGVTFCAMAPLAFWRLRAIWRELRTGKDSKPPFENEGS